MELLLVSHRGIATGMKAAVRMVMGGAADQIMTLELTEEEGIEQFADKLEKIILDWLPEGKKGLIFADLRGGTPYNRAESLLEQHHLKSRARVISGMNLPMIVDAIFKDLDVCDQNEISELVQTARDSIMCMDLQAQAAGSEDE